ncbi:MAG: glycosyltransferase family 2 protein [Chthoniobacterales bacterium]
MNASPPALSIVVPLYNSAETLPRLLEELSALDVLGGHEIVLVNDGSRDATEARALQLLPTCPVRITFLNLSRNFGEHNAILAGLRASRGDYVVTMDDDLQNPPSEVLKLLHTAQNENRDVVYSAYETKNHPGWRNLGSRLTNLLAEWSIDKPRGLYLSSFRCLSRFVADEIAKSSSPTPYIDGLILQVTQNVAVVKVRHDPRAAGASGYNLRRLLRLWTSMLINSSAMPLRIATLIGIAASAVGFFAFITVLINHFFRQEPLGWGSLMAALLVFSGVQLLLLGVVGEYVGRTYLRVSEKPQSVIRSRLSNADRSSAPEA